MTVLRWIVLAAMLLVPAVMVSLWIDSAEARLPAPGATVTPDETAPPVAAYSNSEYCTPQLKQILRRVLLSCGLVGGDTSRGCQPADARSVATLSDAAFNALFIPMKERGAIIQFKVGESTLDPTAQQLLEQTFNDQKGARWFFVVARASSDGGADRNRKLSEERANAVMTHLQQKFDDPRLEKEVGLLWLGEEFAQLDDQFCTWSRSSAEPCTAEAVNRSAFIAWIDCQL